MRRSNALTVSFLSFSLTVLFPLAAAICYKPDLTTSEDLVPCDPQAAVSRCCSASDFCLSNGLCLNAGGNNGYSVQGCTDQNWSAPCEMICPESKVAYDGYLYLQLCSGLDGVNNPFCCGDDYTCCNVTSQVITTIPLWGSLSRPGQTASPSTSTTGTSSAAAASTTPSSSPSPSTTAAPSSGTDKTLVVGAGVGIPLGVALIAALAFLGWQMRKQNRARNMPVGREEPYFGASPDASQTVASGSGVAQPTYSYPSPMKGASPYMPLGQTDIQELHHESTVEIGEGAGQGA